MLHALILTKCRVLIIEVRDPAAAALDAVLFTALAACDQRMRQLIFLSLMSIREMHAPQKPLHTSGQSKALVCRGQHLKGKSRIFAMKLQMTRLVRQGSSCRDGSGGQQVSDCLTEDD